MRPSLLPGLIAAAQRNADRGHGDWRFSKSGKSFRATAKPTSEWLRARSGARRRNRPGPDAIGPLPRARSIVSTSRRRHELARGARRADQRLADCLGRPSWLHPGRSAILQFGPKNTIGAFGEIHPRVLEQLNAEGPLVGFELVLNDIPAPKSRQTKANRSSNFRSSCPCCAISRSSSIVPSKPRHCESGAGRRTRLVSDVGVFDVYEGKGIPEGKKSVAISVTLQPREKTLTEAEIDAVAAKIIAEVSRKTGASLRG